MHWTVASRYGACAELIQVEGTRTTFVATLWESAKRLQLTRNPNDFDFWGGGGGAIYKSFYSNV